jgi:hypothetical protein
MSQLRRGRLAAILLVAAGAVALAVMAAAEHRDLPTGAFSVELELVLPGAPETIYDAITGDISGWWDHSFTKSPEKFYIEPKPGGGFWEIIDDTGDGVLHATVIYAQRGKLLRFDGPLGFSGKAVQMVHTYEFAHVGTDSTRLTLNVRAAGEMEDSWADAVEQVWFHFLVERFKPYVESGRHLRKAGGR